MCPARVICPDTAGDLCGAVLAGSLNLGVLLSTSAVLEVGTISAVSAMMTNQHRHIRVRCRLRKTPPFVGGIRDGFLDQYQFAGLDEIKRDRQVQRIRRYDDCTIR